MFTGKFQKPPHYHCHNMGAKITGQIAFQYFLKKSAYTLKFWSCPSDILRYLGISIIKPVLLKKNEICPSYGQIMAKIRPCARIVMDDAMHHVTSSWGLN